MRGGITRANRNTDPLTGGLRGSVPGDGARPETEQVPGSRVDLGTSASGGMKATTSDRSTIRPSEKIFLLDSPAPISGRTAARVS